MFTLHEVLCFKLVYIFFPCCIISSLNKLNYHHESNKIAAGVCVQNNSRPAGKKKQSMFACIRKQIETNCHETSILVLVGPFLPLS